LFRGPRSFDQLGRAPRKLARHERSVAEYVPHPAAEPITHVRNALVRGPAVVAGIAAIFDQSYFCLAGTEDVVPNQLHRRIEPIDHV
jgi:hypothetical protein